MRTPRPADDRLESLLYPDEPFRKRLLRRSRWIALQLTVFLIITTLAPAWFLLAALTDLALWLPHRKPWMATRLIALLWWGLFGELRGLLGLTFVRLATINQPPHVDRRVFGLRRQWLGGHMRGFQRIFGLRFEIEGPEQVGHGPVVIFIRHASTADTLLPETFVGIHHNISLRYVLKFELLGLPTIDIGRRWVPTVFVRRGYGNTDGELRRLRALAEDLGTNEGLIIYPEGTFYSPEKLARAKALVAERQPDLAPLAAGLRNVLPPKLAGAVALLQAAPNADVVIFGHVGLDRFEHARDVWRGDLVGTTVRMKFWRYPSAEVPREDDEAVARWVYHRWLALDDWIDGLTGTAETHGQRMEVYLRTERLVLRKFTTDDVDLLVELDSDPEVMLYVTGGVPTTRDEIVNDFLPAFLSYYERYEGFGFWAALDRASGEFLGWFHMRPAPDDPPDEVELGYRLRRAAWGRGYATEGSRALIAKAFTELGVRRVHAETMVVHRASRAVMQRAGLRHVRTFHQPWPYPIPGEEMGDVEYALTREEWANPPN